MKDDLRRATCCIIRKNGEYLVGYIVFTDELRWSASPYDAWKTRKIEKAEEVAQRTGGIVMLWNPVVRQMKIL